MTDHSTASSDAPVQGATQGDPAPKPDIASVVTRLGEYTWVESRLFEVVGAWTVATPEPDVKVFFGAYAGDLAWHASEWHERLPLLREVSREALIVAPSAQAVTLMEDLAATLGSLDRLAMLFDIVVPKLVATYAVHADGGSSIRDAPVLTTLTAVQQSHLEAARRAHQLPTYCVTDATPGTTSTAKPREIRVLAETIFFPNGA